MSGFYPPQAQTFVAKGRDVIDTRIDQIVYTAPNDKDARYVASLKNTAFSL